MSKDLFTQMREQEIITHNFLPTKKELEKSAEYFVKNIVDFGDDNIEEMHAQSERLRVAIDKIASGLKGYLPLENGESFGIKRTFRNGGSVANYTDDIVYSQIKKQLEDRKIMLDMALKTDAPFYDSEGVEVPKVSKTEKKSSLAITF